MHFLSLGMVLWALQMYGLKYPMASGGRYPVYRVGQCL